METKGYEVRVINNDKTEDTYIYAPDPGRWGQLNEFYGKAVQEGKIFTCFIKMVQCLPGTPYPLPGTRYPLPPSAYGVGVVVVKKIPHTGIIL